MAAERVPMRKLREVIRLRLACGLSGRAIAQSCRLSVSTVSGYLGRIAVAKLGWPLPAELDDDTVLERLLFPDEHHPVRTRPEPDWAAIHRELRRPHVTKQLLWQEYREQSPDGYQYSQFCARYAAWANHLPLTMRQVHRAGEKGFVDFSGGSLPIVDPQTGATTPATLFLAVLGASNLTYAEPVLHQDLPTWIGAHVNALAYWGGVPAALVPDYVARHVIGGEASGRALLLDVGAGPKGADGLSQAVFRNRGRPVRLLKVVPWSRCRHPY